MYLDAQLLLSDSQALTATAASTNVIDFGVAAEYGSGEPLLCVINVEVAADATTGDETYSVAVQTDDNSSFSSATTVATYTLVRGTAAGSFLVMPLPPGSAFAERYFRLNYTLGGTTPSVTVSAFVIPHSMFSTYKAYQDNITIS